MKKLYFLILLSLCALTTTFSQSNRFSSLYLTTKPVFADTSAQILVRRHSDGQFVIRHASSITGSLTGTGTTNQLAYWTGSATLSAGPYYDPINARLGVNISPESRFHVAGGGTTTSLSNIGTTNVHRIDVANTALSLVTGYLGSDNIFLQTYNNGTNTAKTLYVNPFGGGMNLTGTLTLGTTPSTDNTATPLSIDGSGNVTKKTDVIDGSGTTGTLAYFTDSNTIATGPDWSSSSKLLTIIKAGAGAEVLVANSSSTANTAVLAGEIRIDSDGSSSYTGFTETAINPATGSSISFSELQKMNSAGAYTPTATNIANTSSITPSACSYFRIGNMVMVSGAVSVTPTSTSTGTNFTLTLPVASNFTTVAQGNGTANADNIFGAGSAIYSDAINDKMQFSFVSPSSGGAISFTFTFMYQVL